LKGRKQLNDLLSCVLQKLDKGIDCLPWQTTPSDWFVWIQPETDSCIFIEHYLLAVCYKELQLPNHEMIDLQPEPLSTTIPGWGRNFSSEYHQLAMDIGYSYIDHPDIPVLRDGLAIGGVISNRVECRIGMFAGQRFVFLPKLDIENR
jgi:hypothetical protein